MKPAAEGVALLTPWEVIRVSRLGLIASHLWIFLLPLVLTDARAGGVYWVAALYVTVPLGLLIYGWNDFFDGDVDARSTRKAGSFMSRFFGYRLPPAKRRRLPLYIVGLHLPFLVAAAWSGRLWAFGWLAIMALANALYNGPGVRLSRLPVLAESTATWIYLNILGLAVIAGGAAQPLSVWALAAGAVLVFQLAGAIVDIEPDRAVGKLTFAAAVGERWAARALAAVATGKAVLLLSSFEAPVPAALNLAAVPFCLAQPALSRHHWAGVAYVYFVTADWICLALLTV